MDLIVGYKNYYKNYFLIYLSFDYNMVYSTTLSKFSFCYCPVFAINMS